MYRVVHGDSTTLRAQLAGFMIGNPVFSCDAWKATANDIQVPFEVHVPSPVVAWWACPGFVFGCAAATSDGAVLLAWSGPVLCVRDLERSVRRRKLQQRDLQRTAE